MNIAVVTTFPSNSWDIYSKKMLQSFVQYWPSNIPLLVQLDDDQLLPFIDKLLRPQDGLCIGWEKDHADFVARNKDKDDPQDYRRQPVRFCHKVFAIKRAMDAALKQKQADPSSAPRYLIWMDADVVTTRNVSLDDIRASLPKKGDAVAYLGRKEWDHSECGWLAFDLDNGGKRIIDQMEFVYVTDAVISANQQHDSWIFDMVTGEPVDKNIPATQKTNLSPDAKGLDAWSSSPMAKWSTHYKGPQAKHDLAMQRPQPGNKNVIIQTKNAIPHEEICKHVEENQKLITNWIRPCIPTDEEIVLVSAGPMMIPEDVKQHCKGQKIVAVKHALEPLKRAGVKVWASILLDPRPHVSDFVQDADPSIIWFVASQVNPEVTRALLDKGCTVWGYHANVGAGEGSLTKQQQYAIISGGSATATRGMFVLNHLGFKKFKLFGYDLCIPDKPNMNMKDEFGQPKFMEMSVGFNDGQLGAKRCFWTEPQLIAQFEELNEIIKQDKLELSAYGDGIIPFVIKSKNLAERRNQASIAAMIGHKTTYEELLWGLSRNWRKWLPKTLRRRNKGSR